jgi:hypothetical protein
MLKMLAGHHLNIDNSDLVIGTAEYRYMQVVSAGVDTETSNLRLIPGRTTISNLRLVAVPERTNSDGTTSWLPASMVEPYAGRWVAQSGTKIVSSGDSSRAVANAVRASGHLATVWRVANPQEPLDVSTGP